MMKGAMEELAALDVPFDRLELILHMKKNRHVLN